MLTIKNPGTKSEVYQFARSVSVPESGKTPKTADCCLLCGALISSNRQINHPGTDVCERCAGMEPA